MAAGREENHDDSLPNERKVAAIKPKAVAMVILYLVMTVLVTGAIMFTIFNVNLAP